MQKPIIRELLGRMLAHRLLIERLICRLREVDDFQSMGLEADLRKMKQILQHTICQRVFPKPAKTSWKILVIMSILAGWPKNRSLNRVER